MTVFHLKRNARKLAAYLPACYMTQSEATERATASDHDMGVELVAMADRPDNVETISVEDDREFEWSESDLSSEGWSVVADEKGVDGDWERSGFDNAPAADGEPSSAVLPNTSLTACQISLSC